MKESLADNFSVLLTLLGVASSIIAKVAPHMNDYWDPDEEFGSAARWPLTNILKPTLAADEQIC